ncbi:uncharacterized protein E0L32_010845 [Thyridium curvatum]|uniref:Transmembrane protein n=1 Tax=Thyridium curvatum TaxID=1093900 RepID=A0A507AQW8_9PEZI|nr:uncharacterized protein E0L32_010845 [Thyridium curvatum]TPX07251.1 hypothetical protein E0L32_010845 [Thyridium curvatum]
MSDPSSSAAQPQAVTESTPLLGPQEATRDDLAVPSPQHAPDEERAVGADGGEPGGENHPRRNWTLILTSLSVVFSSSALILYLGVQVLQAIDYHYLGYRTIVAMNFSAVLSFVALICSSFNLHGLRRHGVASMPLGINIIVDILVFVYIFFPVLDALYENISNVFGALEIVIFVYLLVVLFLSLVHLILLVMRTVAAFRARRGTQTRWSIPTGQLTFEFTIKLLRQEVLGRSSPETVQPAAAQGDVQRQS